MTDNLRVVIKRHGGPDVLELVKGVIPTPASGEVRVRVLAAGVGYSDVMAQRGGYPLAPRPPFTPGYDLAGVVDECGADVKGLEKGDHVVALNPSFGCYAEYVCVKEKYLVPFASHLDPAEACSLVLNYLTAYCILHRKSKIQSGDTVLVHSAAGGVGSALVQLAVLAGAKVFGTASSGKHDSVRELGAIPIDYKSEDFVEVIRGQNPNGIDAAYDPIGGSNLRRSYSIVRPGGKIVSYGFAGKNHGGLAQMIFGVMQLGLLNLIPDGKRVSLCALPSEVKNNIRWYKQSLLELIDLLDRGAIKPVMGGKIPLIEARKAHALLESGEALGKLILVCANREV